VIDSIREVVDAVRNSGESPRNETGNELPPIAESSRIALEKALDEAFTKSGLPVRSCHPASFYDTLPFIKTIKKLIWLWPRLIILGARPIENDWV
jgi:hypothetical protein